MAKATSDSRMRVPGVDVLIAGAGPTGLVLALWLTRLGVRVRVIDKAAAPGTTSRALVVQARTLEQYRQVGLAQDVVDRGLRFAAANLWIKGERVGHVELGDMGKGLSPYPFLVIFPQDQHERLLIEHLQALHIAVERPVELIAFDNGDDRVVARLRHADGTEETCEAAYLAGCDGARSVVREALVTGFPGGTYRHLFYVADAEAAGPVMNGELHVALDDADFLAAFPMQGAGRARFIGTIDASVAEGKPALGWSDVSANVLQRLGVKVSHINWFSTYHVHHRVASTFRGGRAFLLGDAAHIHSPVGGQGMNTGLGDAMNLAWKLAAVVQERASPRLLDTYDPERIAFAKRLVATTDRAFQTVTSDGPIARFMRLHVVPHVLPVAFTSADVRRFMFRTVSQTAIEYHDSALSTGTAGAIKAGDRLPWIEGDSDHDNYASLTSLDWQVHVYGAPDAAVAQACRRLGISLHAFSWRDAMQEKGFARDAIYLVRPDGYVGLASSGANVEDLQHYLDDWKIRPRPRP
jgi:2-polyprenyl-6-methoxyphenol hydroxylase-like FAD-dependent oxidoreductase